MWCTLLLSLIIISIILKSIDKEHFNIKASIELFLRLFTNQGSKLLTSYKIRTPTEGLNEIKHKLIIFLLIMLLLSILIINQQFTNALLDIYFNVKSVPIFNTFGEVCRNQKISVKTTKRNVQGNSLDKVCDQDVKNRSNFIIMNTMYDFLAEEILLDVIKGKTVLISMSYLSLSLREIFELNNHITYPEDKRNQALLCFAIPKNQTYYDQIYYRYVSKGCMSFSR